MLRFRLALTFTFLVLAWVTAGATEPPDLETIVTRLERAQVDNRNTVRAYTVTRQFHLRDGGGKSSSAVVAEISFVPPGQKSFTIRSTQGSDRGEKVVRKILEGEAQMAADTGNSDLTRDNYEFAYLGMSAIAGRPCWLLGIEPRKERKDLIRGTACIDVLSYLPRRVEGEMAKTPSWWLKQVSVRLDFDDIRGMWMQTGTQAIAEVRLFGKHELTSRVIGSQASDALAYNVAPPLPNRNMAVVPASAVIVSAAAPKAKLKKATLKPTNLKARGKRPARKAVATKRAPATISVAEKQSVAKPTAMLGAGVLAP